MTRKKLTKESFVPIAFAVTTAILGFLAGFGFQKFVQVHHGELQMATKFHRRSVDQAAEVDDSVLNSESISVQEASTNNKQASSMQEAVVNKRNFQSVDQTQGDINENFKQFHANAVKNVNKTYIEEMLKYFTKEPHLGGTAASLRQARHVAEEWKKFDFDRVELKKYDVLLSYPEKPAVVHLVDHNGTLLHEATMTEEAFFPEENSTESVFPFNAYAPAGNVTADVVYVNYGDVRDYVWLQQNNISVKGKVLIAKYGLAFRGEKARLAQEYGAVGLLLYPDPADFNEGKGAKEPYPHSWGVPHKGIPLGNIVNVKGDPQTPGYPSYDGMFRMNISKIDHLAKIPVNPMSWADIYHIMKSFDGVEVPDPSWQGGMNFTYRINSNSTRKIRMVIANKYEERPIENVVATIRGDQEPDRIVLMGNHRDAWVFGAADPSSGTACLMEVARSLDTMLKAGWRPRRTIMLISWDAEEYGLMGSVEWVEEYYTVLQERAVTYINVDIAVDGNYSMRAKASPQLIDNLFEMVKTFADPDADGKTLYEEWARKMPDSGASDDPNYSLLGSGSDFTDFYAKLGIPCIDLRYDYDKGYYKKLPNYPVYHTIYDNYNWWATYIDPDYKYMKLVTQILLQYTVEIADATVLPYNVTRYALKIDQDTRDFEANFQEIFRPVGISMDLIKNATSNFIQACRDFETRAAKVNKENCRQVRQVNDQMMQVERAFIIPEGLPGRLDIKHVLYGPSRKRFFKGRMFPAVSEAMYEIEFAGKSDWDDVLMQMSQVVNVVNRATQMIKDFADI